MQLHFFRMLMDGVSAIVIFVSDANHKWDPIKKALYGPLLLKSRAFTDLSANRSLLL